MLRKTLTDCIQLAAPQRIGQTHPWPESIPAIPPAPNPKETNHDVATAQKKENPPRAGFQKTAVLASCTPNIAGFETSCKSLLAANFCCLESAQFFSATHQGTALVHTDRIFPHARAPPVFRPDSPRPQCLSVGRRMRARLLRPDSSDRVF
jgi:hypothetical protein